MAAIIMYKKLNQLLTDLGFEAGEVTEKNNRFWRHPAAGTTVVLPFNKLADRAAQPDLVMLREHLHHGGHLSREQFDAFLEKGRLVTPA